jgi:hemerythrin
MALMEWNPDFSVGIISIDNHHKILINYINDLSEAIASHKDHEVLEYLFDNIIKYTTHHFAYEEELFERYEYTETVVHKTQHQELLQQVIDLQLQFKSGKSEISNIILNFLTDWLKDHILVTDKQYTPFLLAKNVK